MSLPRNSSVLETFALVSRSGRSHEPAARLRGAVQGGSRVGRHAAVFDRSISCRIASRRPTRGRSQQADGTLKLYFAVENPSGVSAKALATILDKSLSGLPPAEVATVNPDIVEQIFRQNISMGKGLGLMSMVQAVRILAGRLVR